MELVVLIVGAGPAGLATAACLSQRSIPYLIVEREDCSASLWRYRTYDRVKLHLSKEFSCLPYMPHEEDTPTTSPRRSSSTYDEGTGAGSSPHVTRSRARRSGTRPGSWLWPPARMEREDSGDPGSGELLRGGYPLLDYKSGKSYAGRRVLVVGAGNSGMEIAYDLANHGADTSIVVRSP
ncbi:putative indole-3-pyruvate monooxygenase YUCCA11, partial [Zea mays]